MLLYIVYVYTYTYVYVPASFNIFLLEKFQKILNSMNINYSVHLNKYVAKRTYCNLIQ